MYLITLDLPMPKDLQMREVLKTIMNRISLDVIRTELLWM